MKGKVAFITGGATGIGRAIALRLAKEGADIAINYSKSEQDAAAVKQEIEALGVTCLLLKGTVADDQQARQMVKRAIEIFGRLDVWSTMRESRISSSTTIWRDLRKSIGTALWT
jgi:3-oxoacyl-[acyl-carrier protein] reductase